MGWDYRAKRAAESAYARATSRYKAAKLKYDNANELMTILNAESARTLRMIGKYNKASNVVREAGSTFCTSTNMGFLNTGVNCLIDYQSDWNYSAPHKAGRIFSRSEAKKKINLEDYKKSIEGIYTTSVNDFTIDESPFVYKPTLEIVENIEPTVEIKRIIKPSYNYKANK